jgi:hypothetical protein
MIPTTTATAKAIRDSSAKPMILPPYLICSGKFCEACLVP